MLAVQTENAPVASAPSMADLGVALSRLRSSNRARLLLAVVDLFAAAADRLGETTVGIFDELLLGQFDITDYDALVALSRKLAPLANAPPKLIRKFAANASVAISGPVLTLSPQLSTDELIALAQTHGQDHLHAICARADIPEQLTAVLLKRGGQSIIDRLALTQNAHFFAADFRSMITRASADERRRVHVRQRAVILGPTGSPAVDCTVLNISSTGACLKPATAITLPEKFAVIFPTIESCHAECQLMWKSPLALGVSFEANPFQ
jgi:hypothetical protein